MKRIVCGNVGGSSRRIAYPCAVGRVMDAMPAESERADQGAHDAPQPPRTFLAGAEVIEMENRFMYIIVIIMMGSFHVLYVVQGTVVYGEYHSPGG